MFNWTQLAQLWRVLEGRPKLINVKMCSSIYQLINPSLYPTTNFRKLNVTQLNLHIPKNNSIKAQRNRLECEGSVFDLLFIIHLPLCNHFHYVSQTKYEVCKCISLTPFSCSYSIIKINLLLSRPATTRHIPCAFGVKWQQFLRWVSE